MDIIQEAKRLYNETWDLMEQAERTPEENCFMLHKAHTSCLLWRHADNPVNDARGEWQVSRVYSVLQEGRLALMHGERSLSLCLNNDIGGLDLVFAYEAVARAHMLLNDRANMTAMKELAVKSCEQVSDEKDKEYVLKELAGIQL